LPGPGPMGCTSAAAHAVVVCGPELKPDTGGQSKGNPSKQFHRANGHTHTDFVVANKIIEAYPQLVDQTRTQVHEEQVLGAEGQAMKQKWVKEHSRVPKKLFCDECREIICRLGDARNFRYCKQCWFQSGFKIRYELCTACFKGMKAEEERNPRKGGLLQQHHDRVQRGSKDRPSPRPRKGKASKSPCPSPRDLPGTAERPKYSDACAGDYQQGPSWRRPPKFASDFLQGHAWAETLCDEDDGRPRANAPRMDVAGNQRESQRALEERMKWGPGKMAAGGQYADDDADSWEALRDSHGERVKLSRHAPEEAHSAFYGELQGANWDGVRAGQDPNGQYGAAAHYQSGPYGQYQNGQYAQYQNGQYAQYNQYGQYSQYGAAAQQHGQYGVPAQPTQHPPAGFTPSADNPYAREQKAGPRELPSQLSPRRRAEIQAKVDSALRDKAHRERPG